MEPGLTLSSITAFVCASLERIISSSCSGATVWSKGTQVSSKRSSATCQFETKKGKNMRTYSCWHVAMLPDYYWIQDLISFIGLKYAQL